MSISLPNGTLLAAPSTSTQQYTAAVTRILHLANFSAELKTRDLQGMFRDYENDKGGFRIKWLDDVNALVVFADAATAKRAYLSFLLHPPPIFHGQIRPYDKPDAAQIIQSLAARSLGHRGSSSNAATSIHQLANGGASGAFDGTGLPNSQHNRTMSSGSAFGGSLGNPAFGGGMGTKRSSISSGGPPNASARHHRAGSSSAGISGPNGAGSRQVSGGVLNFNSSSIGRLATHRETTSNPSRTQSNGANRADPTRSASSSDTEPTITMDPPGLGSSMHGGANFGNWKMGGIGQISGNGGAGSGGVGATRARRESLSAEKAMREVEKALANASVEIQG